MTPELNKDWIGFIEKIITEPDEDTHRLVFADWLEEKAGDAIRAEFIRVQCELAKIPRLTTHSRLCSQIEWDSIRDKGGATFHLTVPQDRIGIMYYPDTSPRYKELQDRSFKILNTQDGTAFRPFLQNHDKWGVLSSMYPRNPNGALEKFVRGFVNSLTCGFGDWEQYGDRITWHPSHAWGCPVHAHPIRRVEFTTWPTTDISDVMDAEDVAFSSRDVVGAVIVSKLTTRWPGIEFVLPRASGYSRHLQRMFFPQPEPHE